MFRFSLPAESDYSKPTSTDGDDQRRHYPAVGLNCRQTMPGTDGLTTVFYKDACPLPLDFDAVERDWRGEGFSFGIFRDPPGQEWNDFTHQSDEYVLVAEGRLRIEVGGEIAECEPGDLVRIPRRVSHSLKTLSENGSVWLFGYGYWNET
jgi:mannose-6-phosphate isomerase-like protein (cupin superfamily)